MYLIYVDDSAQGADCAFSALAIPDTAWRPTLDRFRALRREWNDQHRIFVRKEIHARDFVAGRGRIAPADIPRALRRRLYRDLLQMIVEIPDVMLFNAYFNKKKDDTAFEWLLNRVNRTMQVKGTFALVLCDQGKDARYTALTRRMGVFNHIPSQHGGWGGIPGSTKNIPIDRILEDPYFLRSDRSAFIQMVDCCAYALLRREQPLVDAKARLGLENAFEILEPICFKQATKNDPLGIIRVP